MPRKFELRKEIELAATPDDVWEAIATGPGIASWFLPHRIEPGEGGTVTLDVEGFEETATIVAWDPPRRFATRRPEAADGTFHAYEFVIEGRDRDSTVLRFVHSGFLSDDWGEEYETMTGYGWDMYMHTLAEYLRHFRGRTATYVNVDGPPATESWSRMRDGLGLERDPVAGERVVLTPNGLPEVHGVVDWVAPMILGVRTDDALYRFHGIGSAVSLGHHVFTGVDRKEAEQAWRTWLERAFA